MEKSWGHFFTFDWCTYEDILLVCLVQSLLHILLIHSPSPSSNDGKCICYRSCPPLTLPYLLHLPHLCRWATPAAHWQSGWLKLQTLRDWLPDVLVVFQDLDFACLLTLSALDLTLLWRPGKPDCLLYSDNKIAWSSACNWILTTNPDSVSLPTRI